MVNLRSGSIKFFWMSVFCILPFVWIFQVLSLDSAHGSPDGRPVFVITIDGPINPATDDYLKSSLSQAVEQNAKLFVLKLNTPGGLLTSMQKMVESLLESKIPTVVFVSPKGGGAISAGVFVTLAGNFAVMAPGTTIGAAHPVMGGGDDVKGDMGEKVENFAVSLVKAIAEQRGRNVKWAELAVRESVAITDREALEEKVIDFIAEDIERVLEKLEGRTVEISGKPIVLEKLSTARRVAVPMNLKQEVVNILSDPNIAILLGLGAMLGIGIEMYHPGSVLPGVAGVICLVLSLTAGQILPISIGGVALLLLGAVFFAVELFIPSFGIWGVSGIVCLVLGSIYFVDTDMVWSGEGFGVNKGVVGAIAASIGGVLLAVCYLAVKSSRRRVETGREGLIGKVGTVKFDFVEDEVGGLNKGKVQVMGELWHARVDGGATLPVRGEKIHVVAIEEGMQLLVAPGLGEVESQD